MMNNKDKIPFDYYYRSTWQIINKMYSEEALKNGRPINVGFVLINIHYKNGTPSTLLGPKIGIEANSLSRTLKKMEEEGLIFREKNPEDGRSVLIKLTDNGKKERDIAKQIVLKFNESVKKNLTNSQIESFIEVTNKIHQLIEEKSIF